jgi:uncharacterized membrane protein YhaH (DUF805 family)
VTTHFVRRTPIDSRIAPTVPVAALARWQRALFPTPAIGVVSTALLALFVLAYFFALIDNGFLRGTAGPNQYGPDPQAARTLTP